MSKFNSGVLLTALAIILYFGINAVQANPDSWRYEWPRTDFNKHSVKYDEIMSGGPPKTAFPLSTSQSSNLSAITRTLVKMSPSLALSSTERRGLILCGF